MKKITRLVIMVFVAISLTLSCTNNSNDLTTGIPEMDEQHQNIKQTLEELIATVEANKSREEINEVLLRLVDIVVSHFDYEEENFERIDYPDKSDHIAEHRELLSNVELFYGDFIEGYEVEVDLFLKYLQNWVVSHILHYDKEFAELLKK